MELIELRCKNCGAVLTADNVDMTRAIARCEHCGALFALAGTEGGAETAAAQGAEPAVKRRDVPMPKGLTVVDFGTSIEITRRWFCPLFLFLLVFCVIWNGFVLVWHGMALVMGAGFMSCFGLLHTAVGIGLAYYVVAGFVNSTKICADRSQVEVRHGPLPWPGAKNIPAGQIAQIYCRETISHGKNGPQYRYRVEIVRKGNTRWTLLTLDDADQALYIEQELERHLGIEDRSVHGELPR